MERLLLLLALAVLQAACAESSDGALDCGDGRCRIPEGLTLGATLEPPPGSPFSRQEFAPEDLRQGSDSVLRLAFSDSVETTFFVHDSQEPSTQIAAQILVSRSSRISGAPDVVSQIDAVPGAPAVVRTDPDAAYRVVVTPSAPADESYLGLALEDLDLDSGALDLPLTAPTDVIRGALPGATDDARVRLQGTRESDGTRTTVARASLGAEVEMRAIDVVGEWRIGAEVTFVDPEDTASDLPNLTVTLSALATCAGNPCELSLPDVPADLLLTPKRYGIVVTGTDAGGVFAGIPGVYVDFRATAEVAGLEAVTLSAQAVTQTDGTASAYLLDGYEYEVTLRAGGSGFTSEVTTVPLSPSGAGLLRFDLELGPRLTGTVVAANPSGDRAGVGGVVVTTQPSPGQNGSTAATGLASPPTTDDHGAFSFRVDPGVYDLELTPPEGSGFPRWSADNVQVFEDVSGLQVVLPDGVRVPVHVEADGQPIVGATIRILALSEGGGRPPRERAQALTDSLGDAVVILPDP